MLNISSCIVRKDRVYAKAVINLHLKRPTYAKEFKKGIDAIEGL
jgi:hypothetical protein